LVLLAWLRVRGDRIASVGLNALNSAIGPWRDRRDLWGDRYSGCAVGDPLRIRFGLFGELPAIQEIPTHAKQSTA